MGSIFDPPRRQGAKEGNALNQVTAYLTLSLVRAGAELGYGGDLRHGGFLAMLSNLVAGHKRTQRTSRKILHSYIAGYIWKGRPSSSDKIDAAFKKIELQKEPLRARKEVRATTSAYAMVCGAERRSLRRGIRRGQ